MIVEFEVGGNWHTASSEDKLELDLPDDSTDEQIQKAIDEAAWDWFCQYADCWANRIKRE